MSLMNKATQVQIHSLKRTSASRLSGSLLALIYVAAVFLFILGKRAYFSFDQEQYFRDTYSYSLSAELPLTSSAFWAGERSFTLPLFYKLVGINSSNYRLPASMAVVSFYQVIFSALCWLVLGFVVAKSMRSRWMGLLAFILVLLFGLSYDIGKWDLLLLSESLSFSLFALLLAGWIWLANLPDGRLKSLEGYALLLGVILVTILYSFTRDTNLYFLVMAAAIFAAAALVAARMKKHLRPLHAYTLAYLAAVVVLFFAQNASINTGNRWQIHIYDHLAYRIIPNPEGLAYFQQAGLPISAKLLKIPQMRGAVYQDMMLHDPDLEPVRQWTNAHGRATYFGYLLSHPRFNLLKPLREAATLLKGTGQAYRAPLNTTAMVPIWMVALTGLVFPTAPVVVYALLWLVLSGACLFALVRGQRPAWLVPAVLLISMYPLMFIIWHGNPMEIERHALQIAIQFRLAAWLVLLLGLGWILSVRGVDHGME